MKIIKMFFFSIHLYQEKNVCIHILLINGINKKKIPENNLLKFIKNYLSLINANTIYWVIH